MEVKRTDSAIGSCIDDRMKICKMIMEYSIEYRIVKSTIYKSLE